MPDAPAPGERAADVQGTDDHGRTGRRRLLAALTRPSRGQALVGVLLAGLGFAGVSQVRANEVDNTYASYREQDLIDLFNTMSVASDRAQSEIARLESRRRDLKTDTKKRSAALAQAEQAANTYDILAGQVPVSGPGLRITVTETSQVVSVDVVLDTVEELRTAGAEAMEFNDQIRVVAQTSFAQGVGGILVDDQLITSPYTIDVIGDPDQLRGALPFPQGPIDQFEAEFATVSFEVLTTVGITSVAPAARADYADVQLGQ